MKSTNYAGAKKLALKLRQSGKSYSEISKDLGIAKSTLSYWLKDIPFSNIIKKDRIFLNKQRSAENIRLFNASRHQQYLQNLELLLASYTLEVPQLTQRDLFFLFIGLFWGEGSKKEQWVVRVANSDPVLIQALLRFFRECCQVKEDRFHPCIHLHQDTDQASAIQYWSRVTDIPSNQIRAQLVISSASKGKKPRHILPHGTFHLLIRDAALNKKVRGWLEGVKSKIDKPK